MKKDKLFERWKVIKFKDKDWITKKYKVSSFGRIKCVTKTKKYPKGKFIKTGASERYPRFKIISKNNTYSIAVHRLVAEYFLPKPESTKNIVIHLDFDNHNNRTTNLKWVNEYGQKDHHFPYKRKNKEPIVTSYANEKWLSISFNENISEHENYQVSDFGRLRRPDGSNFGQLIRPGNVKDYLTLKVTQKSGKKTALYVHRLVAEYFSPQGDKDKNLVIHLDYNNANNQVGNLKWVNHKGREKHRDDNPDPKKKGARLTNAKLTEGRVKILKKKLLDPHRKTRIKILAKQFGVSEMQLQRIKTGENWGNVTV